MVAAAVLVVILAGGVAVSWHFASEVLVPGRLGYTTEATVEGLAPGRIVLSRSEATQRPGVYGLDWQTGHAIVGEVLSSNAHTVTRRLCKEGGYMATGMKVSVDSDVYVGNPLHALGLAYSTVLIPDELGPMPAWFIPGRTHTWMIVVHGINGNLEGGLPIVPTLHRDGLPTLLISYRNDLGAPRSPDGLHHMGLTEWHDLAAAASYAVSHGARRLILFGVSMGGAIVTQFMERSPLSRRVAGLVLEAPALSWKAILSFNATQMGLPSFAALPVEWVIGMRIDVDWNALDALRHTGDFQLPILFFQGIDDRLVPIATSDRFAADLRRWVTYYRVPKDGHAEAWNVDPSLYESRLTAFFSRITGFPGSTSPHREVCGLRSASSTSSFARNTGI